MVISVAHLLPQHLALNRCEECVKCVSLVPGPLLALWEGPGYEAGSAYELFFWVIEGQSR